MNETSNVVQPTPLANHNIRFYHSLSWRAIFAGIVAAVGIHLLLLILGVGIGLGFFTPLTDQNPIENFSLGSAVAWSICALIALYTGGWLAGCFSASPKTGCLHGIVVWSACMIITFATLSTGGGMALGGAIKALGNGLGLAGKTVATAGVAGAAGVAGNTDTKKLGDQLHSYLDEAAKASPTNTSPADAARNSRNVGFAVTRLFAPYNDINSTTNRADVIKAMTAAGISEADASKMLADWTASYENVKAELKQEKEIAAQKAREGAERAAEKISHAATISFFPILLGLIVTVCGGIYGGRWTRNHTTVSVVNHV